VAVAGGEGVGQGPAHPAEAEEDHVGAVLRALAPADLGELERGVDPPGRLAICAGPPRT
jgi:hypothetical protein